MGEVDDVVGGGEEERGGLSIPAVEKLKIAFTSSKISPEKLEEWVDERKPEGIVFARMGLGSVKKGLLDEPEFTRWLKYVDDLRAKDPNKELAAIKTLTARYGDSDLYDMISLTKVFVRTPEVKAIATRLQNEQFLHWLTTARTPDDVFHVMQLDKLELNIISNPAFALWVKYTDDFNAKYPEHSALMTSTLSKYRYDYVWFSEAETAKAAEETTSIATQLQNDIMNFWLINRKTPEDALKEIGLGKSAGIMNVHIPWTILELPLFKSWTKYLEAYNTKYSHEKTMTMIETLTKIYGDTRVARMLEVAKMSSSTEIEAAILESKLLNMWSNSGKSADDVFKQLRPQPGDGAYDYTGMLIKYVNVLFKKNPDEVTSWLESLKTRYPEHFVSLFLLQALRSPSTEKFAFTSLTETIQGYLAKNESPQKVFELLALDRAGNDFLADPVFQMWLKYVKDFNKKNPKRKESVFTPISKYYTNRETMIEMAKSNPTTAKLAKLLEREQSRYWLNEKMLPWNVFHYMFLKDAGKSPLASPNFKNWAKYLNDFNRRYPENKTTMIDALRSNYNDINLLRILNAATTNPKTEKLALNLQSALINKWVAEKEPLAVLKSRFDHLPFADELLERYAKKLEKLPDTAS